jgi:hypothetical protein
MNNKSSIARWLRNTVLILLRERREGDRGNALPQTPVKSMAHYADDLIRALIGSPGRSPIFNHTRAAH